METINKCARRPPLCQTISSTMENHLMPLSYAFFCEQKTCHDVSINLKWGDRFMNFEANIVLNCGAFW